MDEFDLVHRRIEYTAGHLDLGDLDPDPIRQLTSWLANAIHAGIREPYAMTLATADAAGKPSARVVLVRGIDERGLIFYTDLESRKGRDLAANPRAVLVAHWEALERQVIATGPVERIPADEAAAYFVGRPLRSRITAWASRQGEVIADRSVLESRIAELERRHPVDVPMPPYWGGFRMVPRTIEFWQGRRDRMHDRFLFEREGEAWRVSRLSP